MKSPRERNFDAEEGIRSRLHDHAETRMAPRKKKASRRCAAKFCIHNDATFPRLTYFTFPMEQDRFNAWASFANRDDLLCRIAASCGKNYFLCERHFDEGQFKSNKRLVNHAIPSIVTCIHSQLSCQTQAQADINSAQSCDLSTSNLVLLCMVASTFQPLPVSVS